VNQWYPANPVSGNPQKNDWLSYYLNQKQQQHSLRGTNVSKAANDGCTLGVVDSLNAQAEDLCSLYSFSKAFLVSVDLAD